MKCEITGKEIETTFLGKIIGTIVKDDKGKKHYISAAAQAQLKNDKAALLNQLK